MSLGQETDTDTPRPTPTAITTSVGVVTDMASSIPVGVVAPRTTENGSKPSVVETQLDAMEIVAAREQVLANIYEESLPSVVFVRAVHRIDPDDNQFGRDFFGGIPRGPLDEYQHGAGSGFVWDEEGHILTNWHVVEGSDSVSVVFADGTELDAELLGGDPDSRPRHTEGRSGPPRAEAAPPRRPSMTSVSARWHWP